MSEYGDVRRAALNVEEAALLPALHGRRGSGAALRTALRAAEAMDEKRLGPLVTPGSESPRPAVLPPAYGKDNSRAALHHILRRERRG